LSRPTAATTRNRRPARRHPQDRHDFKWQRPFADLERDVNYVYRAVRQLFERNAGAGGQFPDSGARLRLLPQQGRLHHWQGDQWRTAEYPFAIPVLHDENGKLYLDTILLDAWRIGLLFSLSRAYFMVDMEVPSGYVQFLRSILPNKPRSELYIMLGLGKQGKTMFFRDFIYHLHHSEDKFIMAPGIRGLVMLVFTLPSYPYVFKIIKDVFGASKNMDRPRSSANS
jgi:isocitrate dehydrogenase kinase/phosphatase